MNIIFKVISGWWLVVRSRRECVILSEVEGSYKRFLSSLVWFLSSFIFVACDFHGPWEYYPEEREIYTGIYTYGYILAGDEVNVCFSKVYELDEASSQDFAFYDSAYVTVSGVFNMTFRENVDTTVVLYGKNCFSSVGFKGIVGESYTLNAYFEWDSSGHKAKSRFKAVATIPNAVKIKGLNAPKQDESYVWIENKYYKDSHWSNYAEFSVDFLEYPMDMEFVKVALDYDNSVRGVLPIMNYGFENGESQNTTMNHMFKGLTDTDEKGYKGIAMHDPLEQREDLGFMSNRTVAGNKSLDTLYLMNLMLPIGEITVDLYATDDAYVDYMDKVMESVSDSRVVPESNIENGMGVFSGMAKSKITLTVYGESVGYRHIGASNCSDQKGDNSDSWDSRGCRLYQDVACAGGLGPDYMWEEGDLEALNAYAVNVYRDTVYNSASKGCYASHVKAAMMLDTTKWSLFLPDSINAEDKKNAYADGLKRYCVASNFKSNHIADCSAMKEECLEDPEKTNCKEYLWLWCADRNWNFNYEQCKSALVSRYYLQEQKSSILKREVEKICRESERWIIEEREDGKIVSALDWDISACYSWCDSVDGKTECPLSGS